MLVFLCRVCPKVFLFEIPKKASKSFLSEVFLPKVFRPKVFDFNVSLLVSHLIKQFKYLFRHSERLSTAYLFCIWLQERKCMGNKATTVVEGE